MVYKKRLKKVLLLGLVLVFLVPNTLWAANTSHDLGKGQALLFFMDIFDYVKENYPFEVSNEKLIVNSIKGMLQGLDKNSNFYTREEAESLLRNLEGNYGGIGVVIENLEGKITIKSLIKNSPAERAGLKEGDIIVSIDNVNLESLHLEDVSNLIRGDIDTKIRLGILRGNNPSPIYIDVVRENIRINPIDYKVLEKNIGYIKIHEFNPNASIYIKEALEDFKKKNINKIILDLRDNPGGLLSEALSIGELFIPKGPIVHIRTNKNITTHISTNEKAKYKLAVLINENSASASEIVAGAIKERGVGVLIGKKTYGKGTVQTMLPLRDGSLMKLTTAEYLLPNMTRIHKIGIEPDIEIENTDQDLQLKKAIEFLN